MEELWGDDEVRWGGGGEREWGRCRGVKEVRGMEKVWVGRSGVRGW